MPFHMAFFLAMETDQEGPVMSVDLGFTHTDDVWVVNVYRVPNGVRSGRDASGVRWWNVPVSGIIDTGRLALEVLVNLGVGAESQPSDVGGIGLTTSISEDNTKAPFADGTIGDFVKQVGELIEEFSKRTLSTRQLMEGTDGVIHIAPSVKVRLGDLF